MMLSIVIFLLFFLQFLAFPTIRLGYEAPKVLLAQVLIDALAVLLFIKGWPQHGWSKYVWRIAGSITVLSVWHLVFHPTQTTLFGNPFRLQGTLLLWHLLAFAWLSHRYGRKQFPELAIVVSFTLLVLSTLISRENSSLRAVGTLGEPNALAVQAIWLWPLSFLVDVKQRQLTWLWRGFVVLGLLLVLVYADSRAAIVAFAVQLVFLGAVKLLKRGLTPALLLALAFGVLALVLPFFDVATTYQNRLDVWRVAWQAGFDHPIIGSGFGNIEQAMHQAAVKLDNPMWYQYVDSAHNIFLDWWVAGGIVGLGLFVALLYKTFQGLLQQNDTVMIAIMVGLLTALSFNPASVVAMLVFWWVIGQGSIAKGKNDP